jgi:hypothetical protein
VKHMYITDLCDEYGVERSKIARTVVRASCMWFSFTSPAEA